MLNLISTIPPWNIGFGLLSCDAFIPSHWLWDKSYSEDACQCTETHGLCVEFTTVCRKDKNSIIYYANIYLPPFGLQYVFDFGVHCSTWKHASNIENTEIKLPNKVIRVKTSDIASSDMNHNCWPWNHTPHLSDSFVFFSHTSSVSDHD